MKVRHLMDELAELDPESEVYVKSPDHTVEDPGGDGCKLVDPELEEIQPDGLPCVAVLGPTGDERIPTRRI